MRLKHLFRSLSPEEKAAAGIQQGHSERAEQASTLKDGSPLWHAFAEVSEAGVMAPNEKMNALKRMESFMKINPDADATFAEMDEQEAREYIAANSGDMMNAA